MPVTRYKRLKVPWPGVTAEESLRNGMPVFIPLMLDWFPRLTMQQLYENAQAMMDGKPEPHPDPNLVYLDIYPEDLYERLMTNGELWK
jgi:hypothetical protein